MRLGVFFIGKPSSGGLYQYSLSILDSLKNRTDKVIIFNHTDSVYPYEKYRDCFTVSNSFKCFNLVKQLVASIRFKSEVSNISQVTRASRGEVAVDKSSSVGKAIFWLIGQVNIRLLRLLVTLNRVDLLIFTAPSDLTFKLKIPYIMPVHDLQHRLNPQFPEVSADGIWEAREYVYANSVPGAAAILVDSEVSKEDVLSFYPIAAERVKVLPYVPPGYLKTDYTERELEKVRGNYQLPSRFLFYPANFWQHKNHKLIIEALNLIKTRDGLKIPVVFSGAKQPRYGIFEEVGQLVTTYGLEDQVHYLGYIANEDMGCLYKLAEALVMPTFFGPTNIPYLEAFLLGCPVIGSDIRGVRTQIDDAGLLVDPNSTEALAKAILRLWNDARLGETLRQRGYDKIKSWDFDRFAETLNKVIDNVEAN